MKISTIILPQTALPVRPHPYQDSAVTAVESAYAQGLRRIIVAMATGTGKTITACLIIRLILQQNPRARILWLAHTEELVNQAARTLRLFFSQHHIGIVMADRYEPAAQIVVATVQTASMENRFQQMGAFDFAVVDELQHSVSATYLRLLRWLGAFETVGPRLLGLTATPERGDGQALSKVWERIVYTFSLPEAIMRGYLADVRPIAVPLSVDLDAVALQGDDFDPQALGEALLKTRIAEATVDAYCTHTPQTKAIVFAASVAQSQRTADLFLAQGIAAASVDGAMPKKARRTILQAFHDNQLQVLVNCQLLVEGYDEPDVETVIIARPTMIKAQYLQMVGRGTRRAPNKTECRVIDFTGATRRHSLISSPVLFGLDAQDVTQRTITEAIQYKATHGTDDLLIKRLLQASQQAESTPQPSTPLHWLASGDGWSVSAGSAGVVTMQPQGEGWHLQLINGHTSEDLTPVPVWRELAVGIAEDVIRRAAALTFADPNARWRTKAATEKQLRALARWGIPPRPHMTAGEASDVITVAAAQAKRGRRRA